MDKIIIAVSILIGSNLVITNLFPKTQAVILGIHSTTFVLSIVCIIIGAMLGAGVRWLMEWGWNNEDDNDW